MFEEYEPYPIRDFKGLWNRGKADTCPSNHFLDCENISFKQNGVETRDGLERIFTLGNIKRTHLYKRINESARMLILNNAGSIFDATISLTVPILTIAGMTDFSAVNIYNRVYLSPHDGLKGLPAQKVYVYDGTTIRAAGGIVPSGTLVAVNSGNTGSVEPGTHLFAVVFETNTGFLTSPGPTVFASVLAPGGKKVELTGIPLGPSYVTHRHIIASRAIQTYNNNQFGVEYFFIANAVINDNSSTTATVDFFDSELSDSADYLFDIITEIPAGLVLGVYKNRMVVGNFNDNQFLLRVSNSAEPEVMHSIDGLIVVDPAEAGGVTNIIEHRDLLGITKGLKSYVTSDNGQEPSTWDVISLDPGIGTTVHGISMILDKQGGSTDRFLLASQGGLILFNGTFQMPELSWKIEDIWARINKNAFHRIQVAYDPINLLIYVAAPLDGATENTHVLFGDASDGLAGDKIKWSKWTSPSTAPISIIVDVEGNTPIFKVSGTDVHRQVAGRTNDNSVAIPQFIKFGLSPEKSTGIINHFNFIKYRISGSGSLIPELRGLDDTNQVLPPPFNLSALPGAQIDRLINFVGEKMSLKIQMNSIDNDFDLSEVTIFFKPLWSQRPSA